jgi:hypothetical protein
MNLSSGVSLGQLLIAFSVLLISLGAVWGGLLQRVKTLERRQDALEVLFPSLAERLTRIEEKTAHVIEGISDLKKSWVFRDPPSWVSANPRRPGE